MVSLPQLDRGICSEHFDSLLQLAKRMTNPRPELRPVLSEVVRVTAANGTSRASGLALDGSQIGAVAGKVGARACVQAVSPAIPLSLTWPRSRGVRPRHNERCPRSGQVLSWTVCKPRDPASKVLGPLVVTLAGRMSQCTLQPTESSPWSRGTEWIVSRASTSASNMLCVRGGGGWREPVRSPASPRLSPVAPTGPAE